jgi:hypothetical protein
VRVRTAGVRAIRLENRQTFTGFVSSNLTLSASSDAAAFDPKRKLVFSSNGQDGALSIIQKKVAQTFVSLGSVVTAPTARTMSVDPDTGRIYLVAAEHDPVVAAPGFGPGAPQIDCSGIAQTAVSGSAPRVLTRFAGAGGRFDQLRQCADALTDLRYRCVAEVESYAVRIFALG